MCPDPVRPSRQAEADTMVQRHADAGARFLSDLARKFLLGQPEYERATEEMHGGCPCALSHRSVRLGYLLWLPKRTLQRVNGATRHARHANHPTGCLALLKCCAFWTCCACRIQGTRACCLLFVRSLLTRLGLVALVCLR